jgi:AhpD family alkylhydroperoxidase
LPFVRAIKTGRSGYDVWTDRNYKVNERGKPMSREEVYKEIEEFFGLVPNFFKLVPDSSLEFEWKLLKSLEIDEGPIPNKFRDLIGIAVSTVMKCSYCAHHHTEMAKLDGATNEEIENAIHLAKSSAGWSTYLHGFQVDLDEVKEEHHRMIEFVRAKEGPRLLDGLNAYGPLSRVNLEDKPISVHSEFDSRNCRTVRIRSV